MSHSTNGQEPKKEASVRKTRTSRRRADELKTFPRRRLVAQPLERQQQPVH